MKALVPHLSTAQEGAAGLLVEVKAPDTEALDQKIQAVQDIMRGTGVTFGGSQLEATPLESYPFKKEARVGGRGCSTLCVGWVYGCRFSTVCVCCGWDVWRAWQ
jgi:hypothetical protein